MGAYQIGELIGAAVGMVFLGAGVAWCIRKVMPLLDFRISVGAAMVLLAIVAGFTNSSAYRPYLATVAMYGVAGLFAYFVVVLTWSRQQPYKPLSDRQDFGFENVGIVAPEVRPLPATQRKTTIGIAWGRGFFRVWVLLSVLWIIAGAFLTYTALANPYVPGKYVGVNMESETFSLNDTYGDVARAMDAAASNLTATKTALPSASFLFTPVNLEPWKYYSMIEKATNEVDRYVQRETVSRRSQAVHGALAGIFVPPLVVLILGWAIAWAVSGFRRTA